MRNATVIVRILLLAPLLAGGCARDLRSGPPDRLHASRISDGACPSSAAPEHFAFRSSFWLNLHNFLVREAKHRRGIRDEALGALGVVEPDTLGAQPLTDAEQTLWIGAVDLYARVVLDAAHPDSVVVLVNDRLADSGAAPQLEWPGQDEAMRRALLDVAPIYRSTWWPAHDAWNRAWIHSMQELLRRWEPCLAPRLAAQLGTPWPAAPIRVDASVYASWFGAYTTLAPPHITVATTAVASQGDGGLEVLLHEGGHTMLAPLRDSLRANGAPDPDEAAHLLLFYTAGDLVRRAIPGFQTNAVRFGIWRQNANARSYRALLDRDWRPWLDGTRTLTDALRRVAAGAAAIRAP